MAAKWCKIFDFDRTSLEGLVVVVYWNSFIFNPSVCKGSGQPFYCFWGAKILLQTKALTSLANAISGRLRGSRFTKFSVRCAPTVFRACSHHFSLTFLTHAPLPKSIFAWRPWYSVRCLSLAPPPPPPQKNLPLLDKWIRVQPANSDNYGRILCSIYTFTLFRFCVCDDIGRVYLNAHTVLLP